MSTGLAARPPTAAVERRHRSWQDWGDRLVGSDPGLNRLLTALRATVSIAAVIGAEWVFVHLTGALQVVAHGGSPAAATVAVQHHEVLVIAMLLGAVPAMITGIGVNDATLPGQVGSLVFVIVPVSAALTIGLVLGRYRPVALASFAVLLAVGGWARRFGARGVNSAVLLFIGDFIGFFLYGTVALGDVGWLIAEVGAAVVALIVVRVLLFRPDAAGGLRRTQRSYVARAQRVADLARSVFEGGGPRRVRQLERQLVRLNEAALIIDGLLGDRTAAPGTVAVRLHERLFDIELALTNVGRFAEALAAVDLSAPARVAVGGALDGIRSGDTAAARSAAEDLIVLLGTGAEREWPASATDDSREIVIPHRFARTVVDYCDALEEWLHLGEQQTVEGDDASFEPAVSLRAGWLPGAAEASEQASTVAGPRPGERLRVPANVRIGIQMGVAVGLAIIAGDALSGRRFYWAVLAAFISFIGTNHVVEQIRKALYRVLGTVIGIVIGSLLAHLVGHHTNWSLLVILVFIFLGVYLLRLNYTFLCISITVTVSQLYVQLGEFSNSLLLLRLEETVIGAAAAVVTVLVVLPLRTRRVLSVALGEQLQALRVLAGDAAAELADPDRHPPLLDDARRVDSAYQTVLAIAQPLRSSLIGDVSERIGALIAVSAGARNYARNLVADLHGAGALPAEVRADFDVASATLVASIGVLEATCRDQPGETYVRSAALFDSVQRRLSRAPRREPAAEQLVIRDLQLLDGALARLADVLDVAVTNFDTVPAGCV